jgi:hypothetical protein
MSEDEGEGVGIAADAGALTIMLSSTFGSGGLIIRAVGEIVAGRDLRVRVVRRGGMIDRLKQFQ